MQAACLPCCNTLGDLLDRDAVTGDGKTLGENIAGAKVFHDDVIRPLDSPVVANDTLAVLYGNVAPDGAVIKPPAADPRLHKHAGPAVVFANYDEMAARIDDPDLEVDADSVLVLQHAGPQGAPGMPEWGQLPIPKKLLEQGVRDMVRISDARMSGHELRGMCVARGAGVVRRRPPCPCPRRGRHRTGRGRPAAVVAGVGRGARQAARGVDATRRRSTGVGTGPCICSTSPRRTRAATSTSSKPDRPPPSRRSTDPDRGGLSIVEELFALPSPRPWSGSWPTSTASATRCNCG